MTADGQAGTAYPLKPIERALGMVVGQADVSALPRTPGRAPREALDDVLRTGLQRPPCLLSFSGGRDSSALLAAATDLARREGFALPIPVTLRFPRSDSDADESDWQDQVLEHVGVREREIINVRGDMLDVVGPEAREVLRRHGQLWPFNTHWHHPIVRLAAGGTVITGFGGDELALSSVSLWAERAMARRGWPRAKDLRAIAGAAVPWPLRFARNWSTPSDELASTPWLTAKGRRRARVALSYDSARGPLGWDRVLRRTLWRSRWVQATVHNTAVMADWHDVRVLHPFVEPPVLQALASSAPWQGVGGRSDLLQALFGDLLPRAVIRRESKASFGGSLWTDTARDFTSTWSGEGVDHSLVDPGAVRRAWADRSTSAFSCTLMQQAWLMSADARAAAGSGDAA